jgi:hypothetical protein
MHKGERYCPDCTTFSPTPRRPFDEWMASVDEVLVRKVGVSSADLPDMCYRDLYDEGYSPEETAEDAIEN